MRWETNSIFNNMRAISFALLFVCLLAPSLVAQDEIEFLNGTKLTGTVISIKPLGESKQGDITYTVTVVPDQHDDRLRWNMTASVRITPQE